MARPESTVQGTEAETGIREGGWKEACCVHSGEQTTKSTPPGAASRELYMCNLMRLGHAGPEVLGIALEPEPVRYLEKIFSRGAI